MNLPTKIIADFWSRVDRSDASACWEWLGTKHSRGYGLFDKSRKYGAPRRAHRLSWELANQRRIPEGLYVCHQCDNPPCVNPEHLFLGTQSENIKDMYAKGRRVHARRPKAKPAQARVRPARGDRIPERCVRCGHHRIDDYIEGNGARRCRECTRRRDRRAKARQRQAAKLAAATN